MHAKRINGYDYFYMSVRRKGKITTIYLGQDPVKANEKENLLREKLKIGKLGRPHKFDRNPRFLHSIPGNGHIPPHPDIKREKRSRKTDREKGQVRPIFIVPVIFILVMGSLFILTQADGTLSITISSPLNQTYTTQYIDLNVTTNESADSCQYFLDSGSNTTMSNDSSTNWFAVISTTDGSHNLNVYCNHSSGDWNLNNSIWFTGDLLPPYWTSNETNSQSAYSATQQSCLNITWQDSTSGVHTVYIQGNWSGSDQNYTASNFSDSQFYYCSILPAGTFYWKSWANDTNGFLNSTDTWVFTINPAPNPIYLYLNGSQQNLSVNFGETSNASAYISFGSVSLYRNGESVSNPDIQNLGAGVYIYLANSSGDSNHTSNSTVLNVTVLSTSSTTSLFLNSSQDNLTITYGETVNASAYCDYGSATLTLNSSVISNPYLDNLAAGYYNFTANCSGDANHSSSYQTYFLTVNPAPNQIYLYLNGSQQNLSVNFGETSNASAYISFGSVNLYRDSNPVSNPDIQNLGAGVYIYLANSSGDDNHTSNETVLNVTVNKIQSITTLLLNDTQDNMSQTYGETVNATAYCDYGTPQLTLNSTVVSNPEITNLAAGYYNLTANCSGDSNHSESSKTYFLTVNPAPNPIYLYLNGSQSNITANYGETSNASAYISFGSVNLYRDNNPVSNPDIQNLGAGVYIYLANSSGDANHTSNSTVLNVTVLSTPSTTTLLLNDSADNLTQTYGETVNASAYCDYGTPQLILNDTVVSNPYTQSLASGYYNFTANCSGDANHTISEKTFFLTVNKTSNPIYLYLNGSESNLTATYGNTTNATAYVSYGAVNLYRGGESASNPDIQELGAGTYIYVANSSGDSNHTANSTVLNITITKAASSTTVYLNGSSSDQSITYGETVNATAATNYGSIMFYLNGSSINNPYLENLGAGYYNFTAYSSGDANHSASEDTAYLTVNKTSNPIYLYLNSSQSNLTASYGETTNATAYISYGSVSLYRNVESVSNPDIQDLAVGAYVYLANTSGDNNHTANSTYFGLTVNAVPSTTTLFLNSSEDNLTITYGESVNATAYCDYGTPQLILNETTVSSPYIESLAAGYYNFTANCSGDSNHTASSKQFFLTVNKALNSIYLYLNGSQSNLTVTYGNTTNTTAYISYGSVSLFRNSESVSNPDIQELGASTYIYVANSTGDENHTANSTVLNVTILQAASSTTVYLNGSSSDQVITYGETVNATAATNYGSITFYLNGSSINNPYLENLGAGYYNFTAYSSGDANHSASEDTAYLTVNKTSNTIYLYLNSSQSNLSVNYGETSNATAYVSFGSVNLYRDNNLVSNPEITNLAAGVYVYLANSTGDSNHTANSTVLNMTVNQIASVTSLFLNSSEDNLTQTYGDSVNVTAYCDFGTPTLYLNASELSNPYIGDLGAGYWNFTSICSGDGNHTSSEKTFFLTVNKASNPIYLYLNGSQSNLTATYGNTTNTTAYISYGSINLYRDAESVSNPDIQNLGAAVYIYVANSTGDSNHTANSTVLNVTILQAASSTTAYLNGSSSDQLITYGETVNATAYTSFGTITFYLNGTEISNPYMENLAAGYYNFTAYSSGDTNHSSSEDTAYLTVNKTSNTIYLYLNGSQSNLSVNYGETSNATAYISFGSVSLFRNEESVSNPDMQELGVGTYTYLANSSGDSNHTSNSTYLGLTVDKIPSTTFLFLNDTQDNLTQTYGETVNTSAYCDYGTPQLILNDTVVSNPYTQSLASGYYNFTANCSGDSNHSVSSKTYFLTVNPAPNPIFLYLNSSQSNLTINYGETSNASAYISFGTANLYRDNNPVSNPDIVNLGTGVYVYLANSSGDDNHTSNSTVLNVTVLSISSTTSLFLNSSQDNLTQTYGETVNATAYCDYGTPILILNSTIISNPYLDNLAAGYYNFTANCSGDSNHSSSYKTFFLTVNQASNPIYLYLNGSQSNLTAAYGNTTNATAYISFGTVSLYRNGESVSSPDIQNLAAATYIYVANTSGDSNHTINSTVLNITINRSPMPLSLYLNGSQSNQSYSYGETINATGYKSYSEGSLALYRNETDVGNPEISDLPAGYWNYTLIFSQTENYSSNSTTLFATVTSGGSVTTIYLNGSSSDQSITYGETVNATAVTNYGSITFQLNGTSISNPYLENLGAGFWNFTAYSSGDANHSASEDTAYLTVNKASNPIYLYLNSSQSNMTINYGETSNASAYISFGTVNLYRDNNPVSNPDIQDLGAGVYIYLANSSGDSNHTSNSTVLNVTVLSTSSTTSLFLNSSQDNLTITYGETVNATAYCDYGTPILILNSTIISNPYLDNLAAGYYNFTANCSGDANHTSSEKTFFLTVNPAPNPIFLYLNGSQQNLSVNFGETSNASAYVSYGSVSLYKNSQPVSNPDIQNLGAGVYVYLANSSGDSNHTSNSTVYNVTVTSGASVTTLLLNGSDSDMNQTHGQSVNVTAYCDYGSPTLQMNGSSTSNPFNAVLAAGYYNFTANCSGDANHSASEKTHFLTVSKAITNLSLAISPASPTNYGTPVNATCQASNAEVSPTLYRNGTNVSSESGANVTLAAGTYNYTCNCSETGNYTSSENYTIHQINRAPMPIFLYLNGSQTSQSYSYGETANATGYKSYSEGSLALYRNESEVSNPEISTLPAGYWNYTLIFSQTQNYSANSTALFATVIPGSSVTTVYLNGSSSDIQINYTETVNASAYTNFGSASLYLNGSSVSNPYIGNLGAGFWNFTAYSSGDANHSGSSDTAFLTVNKTSNPISLYLNSSQSNLTANYGNTTNATAYISFGSADLYRDNNPVSNPDIQNLAAGYYTYLANSSGDSNHTANSTYLGLTINQIPSVTTLHLNGSQSNLTQTYGESVNASAYCDYGTASIYLNGSQTASPFVAILGAGYWNITGQCSGDSNHSASDKTLFLTVNKAATNITLLINGTNGSYQGERASCINFTVYLSHTQSPTIYLYQNGTQIASGPAPLENVSCYPETATYNVSSNYSGSQNYTSAEAYHILTIADTIPPQMIFVSPTLENQSNTSRDWIYVNASGGENLGSCLLDWNNGTWQNLTMAVSGSYCSLNVTNLTQGTYYFRVYGNDTSGNLNATEDRQTEVNISLDETPPQLSFVSPTLSNGSTTSSSWIEINVSSGENLSSCLLDWNNGTWQNLSMQVNGSFCYITMSGLSQGYYYFRVYGNDTSGNLNATEDRQIRYYTAPSEPPSQPYSGGGEWKTPQPPNATETPKIIQGTSSMYLELRQGETTKASIHLKNPLDSGQAFSGLITGNISSVISFEGPSSIYLAPGQTGDLNLYFHVPEGMKTGAYFGELQVSSSQAKDRIPITITILEPKPLLDIKIKPLKDAVKSGETLPIQIILYNLGTQKANVRLRLLILNSTMGVIAEKEENLVVEKNLTATAEIKIPEGLTENSYTIKAIATYMDLHNATLEAVASDFVSLKKGEWWQDWLKWPEWNIPPEILPVYFSGLMLIPVLAITLLIAWRRRRKRFRVLMVEIKEEDKRTARNVARFLSKYRRPKKPARPWKIPARRPEESPEEKPEKRPPKPPGKQKPRPEKPHPPAKKSGEPKDSVKSQMKSKKKRKKKPAKEAESEVLRELKRIRRASNP